MGDMDEEAGMKSASNLTLVCIAVIILWPGSVPGVFAQERERKQKELIDVLEEGGRRSSQGS